MFPCLTCARQVGEQWCQGPARGCTARGRSSDHPTRQARRAAWDCSHEGLPFPAASLARPPPTSTDTVLTATDSACRIFPFSRALSSGGGTNESEESARPGSFQPAAWHSANGFLTFHVVLREETGQVGLGQRPVGKATRCLIVHENRMQSQ